MDKKDKDNLIIRKASEADLPQIMEIYEAARAYMAKNGNPTQWTDGYPSKERIREDMSGGDLYVCVDAKGNEADTTGHALDPDKAQDILAVFAFFIGVEDPNYGYIEDGEWLNDRPYGVIHRIAVSEKAHGRGVGLYCLEKCFERCDNLRIDTHKDNIPMQKVIKKAGFSYCGVVYMEDGSPRFAYMKTKQLP